MSQIELSRRTGIDPSMISKLESESVGLEPANYELLIDTLRGLSPPALCSALFLQRQGLPMSSNAMRCALRSLAASAGVEATSHDFRRACAARLLRAGMEADNVARQMGHASISQTLVYGEEGRDQRAIDRFREIDDGVRPMRRSG